MESYQTQNGGDMECGFNAKSTQSLGVRSASSSIALYKENRRMRIGLIILCFVLLVACIALAVFLGLETSKKKEEGEKDRTEFEGAVECSSEGCMQAAAALKENLNESTNPCEDFFEYSCGAWIRNNPIPSSGNSIATFEKLYKNNNERLLLLLLEDDELPNSHAVRKAKRYFKSCMNEDGNDNTATQEFQFLIERMGSWPIRNATWNESTWNLFQSLETLQRDYTDKGKSPLFEVEVDTDPRNSSRYVLKIYPPGLSLIREQYFSKENKTRLAYLKYMTKVGELLGGGNSTRERMEKVMELEGKLAEIIPPPSEIYRNSFLTMNISELEKKAPGIGFTWLGYLNNFLQPFNLWLNDSDTIVVPSTEYLRNMSYVINETDKSTLSTYMMWTFVRSVVPYLSRDFRQALLEYQKETQGTKAAKARWLSCVEDLNSYFHGLSFALGYMWVQNVFDVEIIPFIQEMMTSIKSSFRDETSRYEWVDDQTRKKINEKEEAMKIKVGFPKLCANESLLNKFYEGLNVSSSYFVNAVKVESWRKRILYSRLKMPVDKEEWYTGPQLVNAFYLPTRNEINILAGILQPPFYYGRKAPRAVNYGAIGMILAHELSHGFDASGKRFNKDGELIDDWWSNYTSQGFEKRTRCLVDQYNKYPVDGGDQGKTHVDGRLTLSENIADNGGIRLAYRGYKNWVKKNGEEGLLPGLNMTNDQLLFVSFAQMWCSSFTPSAAYQLTKTDSHALPMYRITGSLSNMKEFSEVFKCPADKGMNPKKKCQVW